MTIMLESLNNREIDEFEEFEGELDDLQKDFFDIKKDSFTAKQGLKDEIKNLGFYNGDENGENVKFNIDNIKKYLESIKNKSRSDLDVKSSELEKGVRTISIQLAINYINRENGGSTNNMDLIDGVRGNQTWKGVKEFQVKYDLKNKDGLPGHETIKKILELLGYNEQEIDPSKIQNGGAGVNSKIFNNVPKLKINNDLLKDFRFPTNGKLNVDGRINLRLKGMSKFDGANFTNKLNTRANEKGGMEGFILKNSEVQSTLNSIIKLNGLEIEKDKLLYNQKKLAENENKKSINNLDNNENEIQSLEDYKNEILSSKGFEEFILSDEGISIITNEIQSHIDVNHINENGEYNSFYEKYPISEANLLLKLRAAWEDKITKDYYANRLDKFYGEDEHLSEDEKHTKKERLQKLEAISNQITGEVDKIIGEYMKSGKENFDQAILSEIDILLSKGAHGATFEELFPDQEYKDIFKEVLGSRIKRYEILVRKGNEIKMNTGDKQIDLQLRSYLYIYGRIFYSGYFESNQNIDYYEEILPDIMKVIISNDDASIMNTIKHKKLLEIEKKLEKERKERDLQRRQEAAKRNRERNDYLRNRGNGRDFRNTEENVIKNIDEATGAEIVENSGINLSDITVKGNIGETILNSGSAKQRAFRIAWSNFKKSNSGIENIFTPENIRDLYDIENNNIDENARKIFLSSDIMLGRSQEDIDKIYNVLKSFSGEFSKSLEIVSSGAYRQEEIVNEKTKVHALGEVIDNIRDIFNNIVEKRGGESEFAGFKLDKDSPAKREGDNVIVSGNFNGTNIKIAYDLKSGNLFMNSFLQSSPGKIIMGNNDDTSIKIGELDSLDTILSKHYQFPDISLNTMPQIQHIGQNTLNQTSPINQGDVQSTNSSTNSINDMKRGQFSKPPVVDRGKKIERIKSIKQKYEDVLYAKIDIIGDKIMENIKKQSAINSTVTKFMKTFNIIPDGQENKIIEFNDGGNGSDLYDFLEIINNSEPESLDKFQLFMNRIARISGLNRGHNNILGPQSNSEFMNIFNESNQNENISLLKNCRENFSTNIGTLKGKSVFEPGYKLGFAQMIKEKLTDNISNKPNRKLDAIKMHNFFIDAGLTPPF